MTKKLVVDAVFWRRVQVGEFFNIERDPALIAGGGGARYIEIPNSLAMLIQPFLGVAAAADGTPTGTRLMVRTIGSPDLKGELEFQPKNGKRLRIANQNRQATPGSRHPAWRSDRGFPLAPNSVKNSEEAKLHYPEGGLRIYIVKTVDHDYYAGFTKGFVPAELPDKSRMRQLYKGGPGGVFSASDEATWLT